MRGTNDKLSNGTAAVLLGFGAYALFPVGDAFAKSMAGEFPGPGIALVRYIVGTLIVGLILWRREGLAALSPRIPAIQWWRGFCVAGAAACALTAFTFMPLAEAIAIMFVGPVVVSFLSAAIMKEPAPPATWVAMLVATVGVVAITRPQLAMVGWIGVLPLITAIFMAFMVVLNRKVAGRASVLRMQYTISLASTCFLFPIAAVAHFSGFPSFELVAPDLSILLRCSAIALISSLGHAFLYMATERGSAAQIAPAAYIHLAVGIVLGALFFGDVPGLVTIGGSALIVLSGLIVWHSTRRKAVLDSEATIP